MSSPKKHKSKSKKSSASAAAGSPTTAVEPSDIPLDLTDGTDHYLHTATDFMYVLIDKMCEWYHAPVVTPYMLTLLMEALVPEAPGSAKRQAEAHMTQYGGGACGKREVVELIKSVQAAGRISNVDVVKNAVAEMDRREAQRPPPAWLVPQPALSTSQAVADGNDSEGGSSPRKQKMGLYAPSLSLAYDLQQQLDAAQKESDAQKQRIAELEATLQEQRPKFNAVELALMESEQPVSIIKKATAKGKKGIIKTGRGAVSFLDEEVAAARDAAAKSSIVPSDAPPPTALSRASMPTRNEVIATARALVAQSRLAVVPLDSGHSLTNPAAALQQQSYHYRDPIAAAPPSSSLFTAATQLVPTMHNAAAPYIARSPPPQQQPQQHSASAVSPWMLSVTALTPYHSDTLLSSDITHQMLTATDVARILSDKRPLSVQREEAMKHVSYHSKYGGGSGGAAPSGGGRFYGSSYALHLEKRSTADNIQLQRSYAVL